MVEEKTSKHTAKDIVKKKSGHIDALARYAEVTKYENPPILWIDTTNVEVWTRR
jgi:hypothetical protein